MGLNGVSHLRYRDEAASLYAFKSDISIALYLKMMMLYYFILENLNSIWNFCALVCLNQIGNAALIARKISREGFVLDIVVLSKNEKLFLIALFSHSAVQFAIYYPSVALSLNSVR